MSFAEKLTDNEVNIEEGIVALPQKTFETKSSRDR